jgi:phage tail-like protein
VGLAPLAGRPATIARTDPYTGFRFLVVFNGRPVAGVRAISGLPGVVPMGVKGRRLGTTAASPAAGPTHPAVTLTHGVSHDPDFESWAASALGGRPPGIPPLRRDLVIRAFDEAGRLSASYRVLQAWVSEYQALPDLDAGASSVTIAHVRLENEGVEIIAP